MDNDKERKITREAHRALCDLVERAARHLPVGPEPGEALLYSDYANDAVGRAGASGRDMLARPAGRTSAPPPRPARRAT
jgi:hypothetical protein